MCRLSDQMQGGCGYDLSSYEKASRNIAEIAESSKIVVEKSTVPVQTGERIRSIFDACKKSEDIHFEVISNPEFLAEVNNKCETYQPCRVLPSRIWNIRTVF